MGKYIKRLFVAPEDFLYIKVDYRVHEVRGLGIISSDNNIAKTFMVGTDLRNKYRLLPDPVTEERMKNEGDVHVMNASDFYQVSPAEVRKIEGMRDGVKGLVFGLIYQRSIKSIAKEIGKSIEDTEDIANKYRAKFPVGMKWIEDTKKFAKKNWFVEAPVGIRRNLWGYLLPSSYRDANKIHADMDRRAVNSPVQGMCAQFMSIGNRNLSKLRWHHFIKTGRWVRIYQVNSVHDSLELLVHRDDLLIGLDFIEKSLTTGVAHVVKRRFNFEVNSVPEIDYEIGPALSECHKWDYSITGLSECLYKSFAWQKEYGRNIDVADCMKSTLNIKDMPDWMLQQRKNTKFNLSKWISEFEKEKENV